MKKMSKSLRAFIIKKRLKNPLILKTLYVFISLLLLAALIGLIICFLSISKFSISNFLNNSGSVAILASLLGATVGGIITYFVTIQSLIQSNHIKSAIINKKTIYEPLLIEFKSLIKDFLNDEVVRISFDSTYRHSNFAQFEVWIRIKNDSRYYQMPNYLRAYLLSLEENITSYVGQIEEIKQSAFDFLKTQVENLGYEITQNEVGIKSFFNVEDLINTKKDYLSTVILKDKIVGIPDLTEEEKQSMNEAFNNYLYTTNSIKDYFRIKEKVISLLNELVEILELIIITITNKYERKSSLF
ncbi:hypothetical protein NV379_16290 [Paenibacillus sp. N1-5-1-14]|uniref:hypothetical protein n=1 Tax=Paenibacillus radicibacter TaxID=2972488 RepID=UPI0021591585|nr:hypothetical protein [Paenibacillus radicibacter]MCR8644214.1 hypothetical protein [Paenibacillus radicibacter]